MNETGYDIRNPALAGQGDQRIQWALQEMPVLRELAARFSKTRPLQGVRMKLAAMNLCIDVLTAEQLRYLSSWQEGT